MASVRKHPESVTLLRISCHEAVCVGLALSCHMVSSQRKQHSPADQAQSTFTGGPSLEELAVLLGIICWLLCAWLVDDFGAELALMRCSLYSCDPCVSNGLALLLDVSWLASNLGMSMSRAGRFPKVSVWNDGCTLSGAV